ncbi:MAG: acyltransferase [Opitutaceae bacterium]
MDTRANMEHDWFPRPLPANVSVGERSWIYSSFAFAHFAADRAQAVRIGNDTGIYNGTFFDVGPDADVLIGDFCTLVGAIIRTDGRVEIGDYSFIAHEVVIADRAIAMPPSPHNNNVRPAATAVANRLLRSPPRERRESLSSPRSIRLAANCWIGMRAVLLAGADLGEGCIVGAGAVVDFAAPPHSIIAGNPARIVGSAV